jgi:hypothetical protein
LCNETCLPLQAGADNVDVTQLQIYMDFYIDVKHLNFAVLRLCEKIISRKDAKPLRKNLCKSPGKGRFHKTKAQNVFSLRH